MKLTISNLFRKKCWFDGKYWFFRKNCTTNGVEKWEIQCHAKFFPWNQFTVKFFSKTLIWRNFCEKNVAVKFQNFHSVHCVSIISTLWHVPVHSKFRENGENIHIPLIDSTSSAFFVKLIQVLPFFLCFNKISADILFFYLKWFFFHLFFSGFIWWH